MRRITAIVAAKLTSKLTSLSKQGGTALPGLVAERIYPGIVSYLAKVNFPDGIIIVTGTNGKTTTAKLIDEILTNQGRSVLRNSAGSNLSRGIIATVLASSNLSGKTKAQIAVLEVDEAYVPAMCKELVPTTIVVTNLFRDQLDRYGELDDLASKFRKAFSHLDTKTRLVLNADDPLVRSLEIDTLHTVFFGVSDYTGSFLEHDYTADSIYESNSNKKLHYLQRYFAHIGIYKSKNSKLSRPKSQIELTKMYRITNDGAIFDVKNTAEVEKISINLPGLYNIYNCLAAIASVDNLISLKSISQVLAMVKPAFGRAERLVYKKTDLRMMLVKNPTGFNQIIQTFLLTKPQTTALLIVINDQIADGRDVSWLWDTAIEDIADYKGEIVCSGSRAYDMALRLKYAGLKCTVVLDPLNGLEELIEQTGKDKQIYILPTYTAMLELHKYISSNTNIHSIATKGMTP